MDPDVMSRAQLSEMQLPKIVRERGQMGVEHVQQACPENVNTSEDNPCSRKRGRSDGEDNIASRTGFSYFIINSKHLLQEIESLNKSRRRVDEVTWDHPVLGSSDVSQRSFPQPGPTSRPIESRSLATMSSSPTCKDQPLLNASRVEHKVGTSSCTVTPENSGLANPPVLPPVSTYGAFVKRASTGRQSTASGTFIISGADGRGGRVTVLKPPPLSLGGVAMSTSQKMKRPKVSRAGFRGQGSLQIEHFFEREKS